MKQTMIRLFSLLLLGMVATGAQAGTYYKKFNVSLNSVPSGAGKVYVTLDDNDRTIAQNNSSIDNDDITVTATINVSSTETNEYVCKLWAFPEPGYKLVGFQKDGESEIIKPTSVIGGERVVLEKPTDLEQAEKDNPKTGTPSSYHAIFEPTDVYVTADYYLKPILLEYQNKNFGTFTCEKSSDGSKVILTAIPGDKMRLVGWHRTTGYKKEINKVEAEQSDIISENSVLEVPNDDTKSEVYRPEFDLAPFTMPANSDLITLCHKIGLRFDDQDPNGVVAKAYKVIGITNGVLDLVEIKHIGPSDEGGHGAILKAPKGSTIQLTYGYINWAENAEDNKDNLLKGAEDGDVPANGKIYVLAKKDSKGLGFYKLADNEVVPKGKAYLELDASNARDFFGFDDETTTSISSVTEVEQTTPVYNMAGQRVSSSFSGLVIQNGRKYIRK